MQMKSTEKLCRFFRFLHPSLHSFPCSHECLKVNSKPYTIRRAKAQPTHAGIMPFGLIDPIEDPLQHKRKLRIRKEFNKFAIVGKSINFLAESSPLNGTPVVTIHEAGDV